MLKALKTIFLSLFWLIGIAHAQSNISATDTLTVMVYNLLNYGVTTSACNNNNNPVAEKRAWLTTIFNHVKPDIVGINELGNNPILATGLLNLVFNNPSSHATFEQAPWLSDHPSTNIVSFLFYNKQKLSMQSAATVNTLYRYPKVYRLYYNDPSLETGADTIFLRAVVTHQKAGNTQQDRNDRHTMAEAIMNYLDQLNKSENRLIMGDFNIYNSLEPSYQSFTNSRDGRTRFLDPINRPGSWSGQSIFADIHTQSTVATGNGCKTGGGLDDRFDFILVNNALMADSFGIRYIPGSYRAIGNDGQRFNQSINSSPTNNSAPPAVINAMVNLSDHLPVVAKFQVRKITSIKNSNPSSTEYMCRWIDNQLKIWPDKYSTTLAPVSEVEVYSMEGRLMSKASESQLMKEGNSTIMSMPTLSPGIYMVMMIDREGKIHRMRVFKN